VNFTGNDPTNEKIFHLAGCNNVTIRVDGDPSSIEITSIHSPYPTAPDRLYGIRVNGTNNATLRDLDFANVTSAIVCENSASTGLKISKITGSNLAEYGIHTQIDRHSVTVSDCVFRDTGFHGIRMYGDSLDVRRCTTYGDEGTGLWLVHGAPSVSANVFRTACEQRIRIGPDTGGGSGFGSRQCHRS
jgi:hypothetical protein